MIAKNIKKILEEVGVDENLWSFYRSIYKAVGCGPMIGFRIKHIHQQFKEGTWVYGSDLPGGVGDRLIVDGIMVSSIVEGSDVEIPGRYFGEEVTRSEWWSAVEAVDNEAEFYWIRDNTLWLKILNGNKKLVTCLHLTEFEAINWGGDDFFHHSTKRMIERIVHENQVKLFDPDVEVPFTSKGQLFTIQSWINDCIY